MNTVGSYPTGVGRWGHQDLAGNVFEWTFDWYALGWYAGGGDPCTNCSNTTATSEHVLRGGGFYASVTGMRAAYRNYDPPEYVNNGIGVRCARTP